MLRQTPHVFRKRHIRLRIKSYQILHGCRFGDAHILLHPFCKWCARLPCERSIQQKADMPSSVVPNHTMVVTIWIMRARNPKPLFTAYSDDHITFRSVNALHATTIIKELFYIHGAPHSKSSTGGQRKTAAKNSSHEITTAFCAGSFSAENFLLNALTHRSLLDGLS